jgi:eukaryotic-like serine/threonine-protein kinase
LQGQSEVPTLGNRYELIEELGSGGMATVYRAFDTVLEVDRAIKLLAPTLLARASIRQRFASEARTMARLRHPNIVTVYDVCNDDQGFYIIMEYIASGSVDDRVQHFGPLPPQMACDVIIALLNGLTVAHAQNVVHRDIKPHNLLITSEGVPKLTDFGIAHVAEKDRALTSTGMVMGTLAYMSPEQKMSARKADARADLYSSAATMYALLTNDEPFDLFSPPVQEEKFVELPECLADLLSKACEYKPENRYQTAEEMIAALKACKAELPPDPANTPALPLPEEVMAERTLEITKEFTTGHTTESGTLPPKGGATGSLSQPTFFDLDESQPNNTEPQLNYTEPQLNNTVDMSALAEEPAALPERPQQTSDTLHPAREQGPVQKPPFVTTPLGLFTVILAAAGAAATATVALNQANQTPPPAIGSANIQQAVQAPAVAPAPEPTAEKTKQPAASAPKQTTAPEAKPAPKPKATTKSKPALTAPKAAPAPPPIQTMGKFVNSDPKVQVVLRDRRGKEYPVGEVRAGRYTLYADFGQGFKEMEQVLIQTGKTYTVQCKQMMQICKEVE